MIDAFRCRRVMGQETLGFAGIYYNTLQYIRDDVKTLRS
jgi:hypothetical protein